MRKRAGHNIISWWKKSYCDFLYVNSRETIMALSWLVVNHI